MTTPERLKRRQMIEGTVLILLAIFTVLQALYFSVSNERQDICFHQRFQELTQAVSVRADLVDRESAVTRDVFNVWAQAAGLVKHDPTKPLDKKEQAKLTTDLVHQLLVYKRVTARIQDERERHPVPPFPMGSCG